MTGDTTTSYAPLQTLLAAGAKHIVPSAMVWLAAVGLLWAISITSLVWADEVPWPTPKLVEGADLVVIGVAAREGGEAVIRVSEVLKGAQTKRIVLSRVEAGKFQDVVIEPGARGVFLLRKDGARYAPFASGSYQAPDRVEAVRAAIAMLADPGPFLDVTKFPESTDLVYVLSEKFAGWSITSKEVPALEWMGPPFYEVGPWDEKSVVTVECRFDPQKGLSVSDPAENRASELSSCLRYHLLVSSGWRNRLALPPRFFVTLDARLPERAGSATAGEAMRYLRERLTSPDSEIVLASLLALATMRDLDAIPHVLQLSDHDDDRVRVRAVEFLGWSGDERAVEPLSRLLEAKSGQYPEGHAVSDAAAESLGWIGRKESLPILERAAAHGVQRAIEAVGALGDDRSFQTMLTALRRNPERCAYIDFALYWLVRRSNKTVEPWMTESSTTQATQIARIPQWRTWWERHKKDFRIIRSQEEAVLSNQIK